MATDNIWELVAKVEANFSQSDRAIDQNERKVDKLIIHYRNLDKETQKVSGSHRKFSEVLGGLEKTTGKVGGPVADLTSKVSSLTSGFGEAAAAAGPVGIAIGVVAAATVAAAAGIVELTISVAEQTGKFVDLSQQTGFHVETLSALSNALETSGGDIESTTNALFIFETKMGEARDKTTEMSKVFKVLGIDTKDNEKALRQAIDAVQHMTDAEVKATLGKKLFGKSAKELLGALEEAGSFQEFYNKQVADGTIITTKEAKAGDDLSDSMILLKRQFLAAGRGIADEFEPMVTDALRTFSQWLRDNQGELRKTAHELAVVTTDIKDLAQFIYSISPLRLVVEIVRKFSSILDFGGDDPNKPVVSSGPGGESMFDKFRKWWTTEDVKSPSGAFGPATGDPNATQAQRDAAIKKYAEDQKKTGEAAAKAAEEQKKTTEKINKLLAGSGKGGGGGKPHSDTAAEIKRLGDLQVQVTSESLRREESDIERSFAQRKLTITVFQRAITRLEDERHKAVLDGLTQERLEIEKNPKLTKLQRSIALTQIELDKVREMNRHRERENDLQDKINAATRERIVLTQTLINLQTRKRYSSDVLETTPDGKGEQMNEETRQATQRSTRRVADRTRPRIATDAEQKQREEYLAHIQKMRELAGDLTNTIRDSIHAGFERGVKAGIGEFALGILRILELEAWNALEKKIAGLLGAGYSADENARSGGGGALSKIIGTGISLIAGLFGGHGSVGGAGSAAAGAIGGFADGGYMRPFSWSWVGERGPEKIRAGYQGVTVLSNEQSQDSGGNTYNITMPIHVPSVAAAGSRETQYQVRRKLAETVQTASLRG